MASEVIERSLYNGLYKMVHNPNARGSSPRYKVNDKDKPKGVTTIMGQTLAKDLMQWAVDCACEYLRGKLPVVTEADLKDAAKAYTVKRDAGAGTGTEAHAMVENYLKGKAPGTASKEAMNAYVAFVTWFKNVKPEVINVEEVIFSQSFNYAGTYDCMLKVDGKVFLCDLKTTNPSRKAPNGVYAENFVQLGAYALAHEEQRAFEEENGGTELVKIDGLMVISAKKNGKLDIVTNEDVGLSVDDCGGMFKRVANIYQFMTYTTAQLGGK
jgi:hypothetical protein